MTLWIANHTVIRVVNTTQCHMIYQLVRYSHFILYGVCPYKIFISFTIIISDSAMLGCLESLEWNGVMEHWNGICRTKLCLELLI